MKTPTDAASIEKLARLFSTTLVAHIGKRKVREVIKRNRAEPEGSEVCHSHDFCDANETMFEAGTKFGLDFDVARGEDAELWGRAWDLAAKKEFFLDDKAESAAAPAPVDEGAAAQVRRTTRSTIDRLEGRA